VARRNVLTGMGITAIVIALALAVGFAPALAQTDGRISGILYSDANDNGVRDEGEVGVVNAEVQLATAGTEQTVTTAADGTFSATVAPGTWTITVTSVPAGYFEVEDNSTEVVVTAGGAVSNIEFAIVPTGEVLPDSGGPISGTVIVAVLMLVLALGIALVVFGRRRDRVAAA
jgi:hypothetical protein